MYRFISLPKFFVRINIYRNADQISKFIYHVDSFVWKWTFTSRPSSHNPVTNPTIRFDARFVHAGILDSKQGDSPETLVDVSESGFYFYSILLTKASFLGIAMLLRLMTRFVHVMIYLSSRNFKWNNYWIIKINLTTFWRRWGGEGRVWSAHYQTGQGHIDIHIDINYWYLFTIRRKIVSAIKFRSILFKLYPLLTAAVVLAIRNKPGGKLLLPACKILSHWKFIFPLDKLSIPATNRSK